MGVIISMGMQKGGVAKTTSVYNVSAVLANKGYKVLMIDFDPQASLTLSAGYNPLDFETTICDVLSESRTPITEVIYNVSAINNLQLVPSLTTLAAKEINLLNERARENKLKKALQVVKKAYDYIVIDCPPQLSLLTINAFTASDYILIPCETSKLSFFALGELFKTIKDIQEDLNEDLKILGVVATLYDQRITSHKDILNQLYGLEQCEVLGIVKKVAAAQKGLGEGLPVVITEPNHEVTAAYIDIAEKVINYVGSEAL